MSRLGLTQNYLNSLVALFLFPSLYWLHEGLKNSNSLVLRPVMKSDSDTQQFELFLCDNFIVKIVNCAWGASSRSCKIIEQ